MKIKQINYSYPVLSQYNEDYINSKFEVDYQVVLLGIEQKAVDLEVSLVNREIEDGLLNKDFKMIVHIECPKTSYREIQTMSGFTHRILIDPKQILGELEINCIIVTNRNLYEYKNACFNPYFYPENFSVKNLPKGSIVAINPTVIVEVETDRDSLKNMNSIISVAKNSTIEHPYTNIDGDNIRIEMPTNLYELYYHSQNSSLSQLVLSSVILPSLVYSLSQMPKVQDTTLTWYRVIKKKLEKINLTVEDIDEKESSFVLAQKLLESPINQGLEQIESWGED